jgi:hypothetical protein
MDYIVLVKQQSAYGGYIVIDKQVDHGKLLAQK